MDIAALIVSIISILFTLVLTIWQIITSIKINNINLKSTVYEKIFDKYLIHEIPDARRLMSFDEKGKFTGANQLKDVVVQLLKDSLYFRYNDRIFYDGLEKLLQELEDLLVQNMDKEIDTIKQTDLLNNIETKIKNIYEYIENKKIKGS